MRFLKIMGIFTSILSLLSCGHGNKRVTQNDGINSNIPVAARITIDKLPDVLRNVQAGNTDYDFIGICVPMVWTASTLCWRTESFT
mgnify:CR=1 FL=1